MRETIAVAIGGMFGSVLRYWVSWGLEHRFGGFLPWGTLLVNVGGCFAIGVLWAFTQRTNAISPIWELALRAGFLGGLTTFSSFGLEVIKLGQSDRWQSAVVIVVANVVLGLSAVCIGQSLGQRL
jgi:fluoride exporter